MGNLWSCVYYMPFLFFNYRIFLTLHPMFFTIIRVSPHILILWVCTLPLVDSVTWCYRTLFLSKMPLWLFTLCLISNLSFHPILQKQYVDGSLQFKNGSLQTPFSKICYISVWLFVYIFNFICKLYNICMVLRFFFFNNDAYGWYYHLPVLVIY